MGNKLEQVRPASGQNVFLYAFLKIEINQTWCVTVSYTQTSASLQICFEILFFFLISKESYRQVQTNALHLKSEFLSSQLEKSNEIPSKVGFQTQKRRIRTVGTFCSSYNLFRNGAVFSRIWTYRNLGARPSVPGTILAPPPRQGLFWAPKEPIWHRCLVVGSYAPCRNPLNANSRITCATFTHTTRTQPAHV